MSHRFLHPIVPPSLLKSERLWVRRRVILGVHRGWSGREVTRHRSTIGERVPARCDRPGGMQRSRRSRWLWRGLLCHHWALLHNAIDDEAEVRFISMRKIGRLRCCRC
jgi:hypothetical protein